MASGLAPGHALPEWPEAELAQQPLQCFSREREAWGEPAKDKQGLCNFLPVTRCLFFSSSSRSLHLQTQTTQEEPKESVENQWQSRTDTHPLEKEARDFYGNYISRGSFFFLMLLLLFCHIRKKKYIKEKTPPLCIYIKKQTNLSAPKQRELDSSVLTSRPVLNTFVPSGKGWEGCRGRVGGLS